MFNKCSNNYIGYNNITDTISHAMSFDADNEIMENNEIIANTLNSSGYFAIKMVGETDAFTIKYNNFVDSLTDDQIVADYQIELSGKDHVIEYNYWDSLVGLEESKDDDYDGILDVAYKKTDATVIDPFPLASPTFGEKIELPEQPEKTQRIPLANWFLFVSTIIAVPLVRRWKTEN
jgi:hypothetical protein